MKILLFNWRDITNPQAGGAELYLHEIGRRLASEHEVTLFCGRYPGSPRQEHKDSIRIVRRGGIFTLYLWAVFEYLSRFRKENYDVVVDCINGIPFFTPLYVRGPKKVAHIHHLVKKDIFFRELPFPFSLVGWLMERSIPIIYKGVPLITVSDSSRMELIEFGIDESSISLVFNATDHAPLRPREKSQTPLIAYVGRAKRYKQLDQLATMFGLIREKMPHAELIIAGRGDFASLMGLGTGGKGEPNITLAGEVSEHEKADILGRAWVFVTPSRKEGWGISVMEAHACGTPSVAYDVPGLRDSIRHGETGLLVPGGSPQGLAEAVVQILTDAELRERLSQGALKWASLFSWDKSAERFMAALADAR